MTLTAFITGLAVGVVIGIVIVSLCVIAVRDSELNL